MADEMPPISAIARHGEQLSKLFYSYVERTTLLAVLWTVAVSSRGVWALYLLAGLGTMLLALPAAALAARFLRRVVATSSSLSERVAQAGFWITITVATAWIVARYFTQIIVLLAELSS